MDIDRKYLKDVLPRLYQETVAFLEREGRLDLLEQLPHLYITGRCACGDCSDFHLDSDLPELNRAAGSTLLLRPLYWPIGNGFYLGLSGKEGLMPGEHERSYVTDYELSGGDYRDYYIHWQLNAHGFKVDRKFPKRKRPGSIKRRVLLKNRRIRTCS